MRIRSKKSYLLLSLAVAVALLLPAAPLFAQSSGSAEQAQPVAESAPATESDAVSASTEWVEESPAAEEAPATEAVVPVTSAPATSSGEPGFDVLYGDASDLDKEILGKVERMAAQGQWKSAWSALAELDPNNTNPFIFAEKVRLALDGWAQNTMHLLFGFVDLPEGENLEMLRFGTPETGDPVEFNPAQISDSLEERGEAIPPVLSFMLGKYYHTVWENYQGQWLMADEEILVRGVESFDRALAYDLYSADSLDKHSGMLIALQRFDGAEKVLSKALELAPESNSLRVRMADVYYASGRYDDVYALADKVIASAADDGELNDGYIVAIKAGLAALDKERLTPYIDGLELSFPNDYTPGLIRHLIAVQLGDPEGADTAADKVTETFGGDPEVVRSLLSTWLSANDPDSGFRYLERAIAKGGADGSMASFYFYKAMLQSEIAMSPEDLQLAKSNLQAAREYFSKSYPEGHEIFGLLDEIEAEWEAALNPPPAEEAAAPQSEAPAEGAAAPQPEAPAAQPSATEPPAAQPPASGQAEPAQGSGN